MDALRLACISDIHGNTAALDAVLVDVHRRSVDEVWASGDLVALGPDPVATLERLAQVRSIRFLAGHTDRYTVTGDRPPPSLEDAASDDRLRSQRHPAAAWIAAHFAA